MPQPLIKNQYPGQTAPTPSTGVKDMVSCNADGSIRYKTPGIASVTHQATGIYAIQLTAPLETNPLANPIAVKQLSLPFEPLSMPVVEHLYVVGNQTLYVYLFAWNGAGWTPYDARFNLAIFNIPSNITPPLP